MNTTPGILTINGKRVDATEFAYDGCHKIYLIATEEDRETMKDCGYEEDDIYPVSDLAAVWEDTCFLRFINSADLKHNYVAQGANAPQIAYQEGTQS